MTQAPVTMDEALRYDLESLEDGIVKCDKNIVIFEEAIKKERETQNRYREMIAFIKASKK